MKTVAIQHGFAALATFALLSTSLAAGAGPRRIKVSTDGSSVDASTAPGTTTTTVTDTAAKGDYASILVNGYSPKSLSWSGRSWRVNSGATWNANLVRSIMISPSGKRTRFELQNYEVDKASGDSTGVRRSELSGSLYGDATRLPNSVSLWGAMSFVHGSWADPVGMATKTGGVYGQIHIGSTFGGSPAVGFRRAKDGRFRITTRGELSTASTIRYQAPLSFDTVHDLVYNVVLDPVNGSLKVWLDGALVVDVSKVSIGTHYAESYFNHGTYFSGGITTPVVAEYANIAYPGQTSLLARVNSRPVWPI